VFATPAAIALKPHTASALATEVAVALHILQTCLEIVHGPVPVLRTASGIETPNARDEIGIGQGQDQDQETAAIDMEMRIRRIGEGRKNRRSEVYKRLGRGS
jgi:hypothetical protein